MTLDLYALIPGDRVRTTDGAIVEIVDKTQDGQWILVRYLEGTEDPGLVGSEDLCHEDELAELVSSHTPN